MNSNQMTDKYINPFTDFGFKKLFGEEANKDLLIDFLNEVLQGRAKIKHLTYLKNEHLGYGEADRKAIFNLYCENEKGEKFIVELQKAEQKFFKDRSLYYSTFPIQEQAKQGDWNFELQAVYTIAIMDFIFEEEKKYQHIFQHNVQLFNQSTQQPFYHKLWFIYLEMPKFDKTENELTSHYEKWLFVLKNLAKLQGRPKALQEKVFQKLLEQAEIAKFDRKEQMAYQDSLKYYRDLKNSFDTYFERGQLFKAIEMAKKMKQNGESIEKIIEYTGLNQKDIESL